MIRVFRQSDAESFMSKIELELWKLHRVPLGVGPGVVMRLEQLLELRKDSVRLYNMTETLKTNIKRALSLTV